MIVYVLTRTAARPSMFERARASVLEQRRTFPGDVVHVVHAEAGFAPYAIGDELVIGERLERRGRLHAPQELYVARLLRRVLELEPGWVVHLDDDDVFAAPDALERALLPELRPDQMPVWTVEREHGRISPASSTASLSSLEGRICWEGASHYSTRARPEAIDDGDGGDGRYWAALALELEVVRRDVVFARPQVGKGKGRRSDY